MKNHHYQATISWTGNNGTGTSAYRDYERSHTIQINRKPTLYASSDPAFRGDQTKHNPEDLLVASLSSCHMLWYLHLCAEAGIIVTQYTDTATGTMQETDNGGHFTQVTLNPIVTLTNSLLINQAIELHKTAHKLCFIANSVNFPVHHNPVIQVESNS